jgi:uncharacterized protein (DUF305 family)
MDMARVELKYGRNPEIRKLAEKIIADQQKEITVMPNLDSVFEERICFQWDRAPA